MQAANEGHLKNSMNGTLKIADNMPDGKEIITIEQNPNESLLDAINRAIKLVPPKEKILICFRDLTTAQYGMLELYFFLLFYKN